MLRERVIDAACHAQVGEDENDGVKLFATLRELETVEDVCAVLGKIEGPSVIYFAVPCMRKLSTTISRYAIVFYHVSPTGIAR